MITPYQRFFEPNPEIEAIKAAFAGHDLRVWCAGDGSGFYGVNVNGITDDLPPDWRAYLPRFWQRYKWIKHRNRIDDILILIGVPLHRTCAISARLMRFFGFKLPKRYSASP